MKFTAVIVMLLAVQFAPAQIKVVKLGEKDIPKSFTARSGVRA
jgi:hypothetical protein